MQYLSIFMAVAAYLSVATFLLFVLIMHFDRARQELTPDLLFLGERVLLPIGAVHNALFTVLVGTVLFLDIPRELTTTARLNRYWRDGPNGWRKNLALFIRHRLDPFDKRGIHS